MAAIYKEYPGEIHIYVNRRPRSDGGNPFLGWAWLSAILAVMFAAAMILDLTGNLYRFLPADTPRVGALVHLYCALFFGYCAARYLVRLVFSRRTGQVHAAFLFFRRHKADFADIADIRIRDQEMLGRSSYSYVVTRRDKSHLPFRLSASARSVTQLFPFMHAVIPKLRLLTGLDEPPETPPVVAPPAPAEAEVSVEQMEVPVDDADAMLAKADAATGWTPAPAAPAPAVIIQAPAPAIPMAATAAERTSAPTAFLETVTTETATAPATAPEATSVEKTVPEAASTNTAAISTETAPVADASTWSRSAPAADPSITPASTSSSSRMAAAWPETDSPRSSGRGTAVVAAETPAAVPLSATRVLPKPEFYRREGQSFYRSLWLYNLALAFLSLAVVGGLAWYFVDPINESSFGLADFLCGVFVFVLLAYFAMGNMNIRIDPTRRRLFFNDCFGLREKEFGFHKLRHFTVKSGTGVHTLCISLKEQKVDPILYISVSPAKTRRALEETCRIMGVDPDTWLDI